MNFCFCYQASLKKSLNFTYLQWQEVTTSFNFCISSHMSNLILQCCKPLPFSHRKDDKLSRLSHLSQAVDVYMLNKAVFILGISNTYCNKLAGRLSHLQSWGLCSATAIEQFCYTTVLGQYLRKQIESIQQTLTELQKKPLNFKT